MTNRIKLDNRMDADVEISPTLGAYVEIEVEYIACDGQNDYEYIALTEGDLEKMLAALRAAKEDT